MSNITNIIKDLGAVSKRIIRDPAFFTHLSSEDQETLTKKLRGYSPKVAALGEMRDNALTIIDGLAAGEDEINIPVVPNAISEEIAQKIARETFIFEFHFSQPTFMKKVDSSSFLDTFGNNGNIDAQRVRISKYLLERADLKEVSAQGREWLKYLRDISLPGGLLTPGAGQYLVPLTHLEDLRARLTEFVETRSEVLDRFVETYPSLIEKSKTALGAEFRPDQYPPPEAVKDMFTTSYKFVSNQVPEEFERVSKEIREMEEKRILAECAVTGSKIQSFLREGFSGLVEHMVDILGTDEETGKPKQFQKSSVEKLAKFVENFKSVDLVGDNELGKLVSQTKDLLDGVDPKKIRTDEEVRATLNQSFAAIKDAASRLVTTRVRKVDLD